MLFGMGPNGPQPIIVEVDCDVVYTMLFGMPQPIIVEADLLYTQCYLEWAPTYYC